MDMYGVVYSVGWKDVNGKLIMRQIDILAYDENDARRQAKEYMKHVHGKELVITHVFMNNSGQNWVHNSTGPLRTDLNVEYR